MAGRTGVELREHRLLDLHPLGHGLDDEVDVAEAVVVRRPRDAAEDLLRLLGGLLLAELLLGDEVAELRPRDLFRLLEAEIDELLLDVLQHHRDPG